MDSTTQTAPTDLKSSLKTESLPSQKSSTNLHPRLTRGFDSAYSPYGLRNHHWNWVAAHSENINETASTVEKWIRQCIHLLWTQKS
jgi:hypothetical protein